MVKINYYSYPFGTGYGNAAKAYVHALSNIDNLLINQYISNHAELKIKTELQSFSDNADIHFIHKVPTEGINFIQKSAKNILSTVFEADKLTSYFARALNHYDEITVPCSWNLETFKNYSQKKIHLLPHLPEFFGVSPQSEPPPFIQNIPKDTCVFLNISGWGIRKNIENMILTFNSAFNKSSDVLLIFKTSLRDLSKRYLSNLLVDFNLFRKSEISFNKILNNHGIKANILFINEYLSADQMMHLYNRADCFFTMSHCEGWGMGSFESSFYGKPVIATAYGGHLDYLSHENSFLIPYKIIPFPINPWDQKEYYKDFTTADPNKDTAIELLRFVFKNKEEAQIKGSKLKSDVTTNFSTEKITKILKEIISC